MSDIKTDGEQISDLTPTEHPAEKSHLREEITPLPPVNQELKNAIELKPSYVQQGNEMVVMVKMLESINKNIAFLAQTIFQHLNPDQKPKA